MVRARAAAPLRRPRQSTDTATRHRPLGHLPDALSEVLQHRLSSYLLGVFVKDDALQMAGSDFGSSTPVASVDFPTFTSVAASSNVSDAFGRFCWEPGELPHRHPS
jgi:hypothetical protein